MVQKRDYKLVSFTEKPKYLLLLKKELTDSYENFRKTRTYLPFFLLAAWKQMAFSLSYILSTYLDTINNL